MSTTLEARRHDASAGQPGNSPARGASRTRCAPSRSATCCGHSSRSWSPWIFSFNEGRSRIAVAGLLAAVVEPRPPSFAAARPADALGDETDLPARDPDGADRRSRSGRCSRSASTGGTDAPPGARTSSCCCRSWYRRSSSASSLFILFNDACSPFVIRSARTPRSSGWSVFQVSYPADHRAGPAAHDRAGVRGGGDGPGCHAESGDPSGPAPAASLRRSSRASRSCSPTSSTTS